MIVSTKTFLKLINNIIYGISRILLIFFFGTCLTAGCALQENNLLLKDENSPTEQGLNLKRMERVIDSLAESYILSGITPGISVAVAKEGEILIIRGYGQSDVEMGVKVDSETVFGIRSITKQFTAAIIMQLVKTGKISLDDPITKYLPNYPVQGNHVTIHNLLNHTSGIKDYEPMSKEHPNWIRLDLSYEKMISLWGNQPFDFEPGEKYSYNGFAYYLLGEIISRVTEMTYGDYVENKFLRPLGLKHTYYGDARQIIPKRAEGYEHEGDTLINSPYLSMHIFRAGGSLFSTAADLIRWNHLLHSGQVVSTESLHRMITPTVLASGDTIPRGYGLYLGDLSGHPKIHHGGVGGFGTYLSHYPENGLAIAVLTNSSRGREKASEMEEAIARVAFGIEILNLPLSKEDLAFYEGTYKYTSGKKMAKMRIFGEDGQLKVQIVGKPNVYRLLYQGNDVFVPLVDRNDRFVFAIQNGQAVGYVHQEGKENSFYAKRIKTTSSKSSK